MVMNQWWISDELVMNGDEWRYDMVKHGEKWLGRASHLWNNNVLSGNIKGLSGRIVMVDDG